MLTPMFWKISFVVGINKNLEQAVSNMLTISSTFATHEDARGAHLVVGNIFMAIYEYSSLALPLLFD